MTVQNVISDLRSKGYVVRCHHVREFPFVAADTPDGLDNHLTRGEFGRAVDAGNLVVVDPYSRNCYPAEGDELVFGRMVSPTGGFTKVDICLGDKVVSSGKRNFTRQPFNKKVGLIAAFNQALSKLN